MPRRRPGGGWRDGLGAGHRHGGAADLDDRLSQAARFVALFECAHRYGEEGDRRDAQQGVPEPMEAVAHDSPKARLMSA